MVKEHLSVLRFCLTKKWGVVVYMDGNQADCKLLFESDDSHAVLRYNGIRWREISSQKNVPVNAKGRPYDMMAIIGFDGRLRDVCRLSPRYHVMCTPTSDDFDDYCIFSTNDLSEAIAELDTAVCNERDIVLNDLYGAGTATRKPFMITDRRIGRINNVLMRG